MAIEEVRPQDVERYQGDDDYQVLLSGTPGQPRMILVNTQQAPTDDLAVRRACLLATDQDTIITALYKGVYQPSHSLLDPLTPCYAEDLNGYVAFNLDEANRVLDEAGWVKNGDIREKDGQRLEILFLSNTANDFRSIAELMQATYREVGIEMRIEFESQPSVFSTYQQGPQNFADFFFWSPDPDQLSATYHSRNIESGFNWSHFSNPDFDALVDQAARESDSTARCELYHQAQVILWDQAASIPIQQKAAVLVAQNRVKNVAFDGNAYPYYYDTTIEE
jgi:peptide/nickel transport system substrate-binding protein